MQLFSIIFTRHYFKHIVTSKSAILDRNQYNSTMSCIPGWETHLFVQTKDKEATCRADTLHFFFANLRLKLWCTEFTQRSDPIRTVREEKEPKLICYNSASKENITSTPFYSRRMTCGSLCKDCSLGCPCGLQQCTHAPKQNLQDHKAANSILGHLWPRGHCLWTGTSALQPLSRWDSARSMLRTEKSKQSSKSFCLNTSETESSRAQKHACKQFRRQRNLRPLLR